VCPGDHGLSAGSPSKSCTVFNTLTDYFEQNSLRRRFGNALQWYSHLQNQTKARYRAIIDALRPVPEPATDRPDEAPNEAPVASPPVTPTHGARRQAERASESPTRKRPRDYTPECPPAEKATSDHPPPFGSPKPRARPSNYLRNCCPACFGDLSHDGTLKQVFCMCHPKFCDLQVTQIGCSSVHRRVFYAEEEEITARST